MNAQNPAASVLVHPFAMSANNSTESGEIWSARLDATMVKALKEWASQYRFLSGKSAILKAFIESNLPGNDNSRRRRAA